MSKPVNFSDLRAKKAAKKESLKAKKWSRIKPKPVAVKVMKDGREICQENAAGRTEYVRRTGLMVIRQCGFCRCGKRICILFGDEPPGWYRATFGHDTPRGHGGGRRDDRIFLPDGTPINHAECWNCNSAKGSRRTHETLKPCPKREKLGKICGAHNE